MKNRIEVRMEQRKQEGQKALITYMTAGLPDMEGCKALIKAQEEAGTDVIELGIPFSDPAADGPVIQDASCRSILKGTNLKKVFGLAGELRREGCQIPLVFMLYYNTVFHYGLEDFVKACEKNGVDGLIIPDLPREEQGELRGYLEREGAPILIPLVSPVSGKRIPKILEGARGFVYCVSAMGVTGQEGSFHRGLVKYLTEVKKQCQIPVMMGFGIRNAKDVEPVRTMIDGVIVGSHFITLMEQSGYDLETAREYCSSMKRDLNKEE